MPSLQTLLERVSGRKVVIPSRRKFMNTLDQQFVRMRDSLKQVLKEQKYICITCDVWSSRAQSYLGVTVHFINEHFERESFLLSFKRLFGRQTYVFLAEQLDSIFKDYEIDIDKITNIVTDGGSAFCKAFKEFGSGLDSSLYVGENDYDDEEDNDEPPTDSSEDIENVVHEFMQSEDGELLQSEILDFGDQEINVYAHVADDYFGSTLNAGSSTQAQRIKLPKQRRCFSHHCNLVSKDFEKKLPSAADKVFKNMYEKLNSLWHLTNRSCRAKTICKDVLGCKLNVPCATRWNSKFDSIKKFFDIIKRDENVPLERNPINMLIRRLMSELKSASHLQRIESYDVLVMEKYIKVMQPVAQALDTLQGEKNCSQGLIVPVLRSMNLYIEELTFTSNFGKDFQETMLQVKVLPLNSTFLLMNKKNEFRRIEFLFMNSIINESHPIWNLFSSIY